MGLETPTYVNDFITTNPTNSDPKSQGDDHIRNLKIALQNTFPGMAGRFARIQNKSGAYTALATDNATVLNCTGTWTLALTAAATLGNGWVATVFNNGSGTITIDPDASETINGAATLSVAAGILCILWCDGSNFIAMQSPIAIPANEVPTGTVANFAGYSAPSGWFFCDGSAKSRSTYASLFAAITTSQDGSISSGTPTVTGLTSTAGFYAGMDVTGTDIPAGTWIKSIDSSTQITLSANASATGTRTITFYPFGAGDGSTTFNLPTGLGRSAVGVGTGTLAVACPSASVNTTNDTWDVPSNNTTWITGMSVVLTTTGTLPTGLSLATTYYVIRDSATTVKFATSLANAVAGTAIDITAQGSGTHTMTHTLTARTLGEKLGEEAHASTISETPAHTHDDGGAGAFLTIGSGGDQIGSGVGGRTDVLATASTGGSGAHNNMQPGLGLNWIIKH